MHPIRNSKRSSIKASYGRSQHRKVIHPALPQGSTLTPVRKVVLGQLSVYVPISAQEEDLLITWFWRDLAIAEHLVELVHPCQLSPVCRLYTCPALTSLPYQSITRYGLYPVGLCKQRNIGLSLSEHLISFYSTLRRRADRRNSAGQSLAYPCVPPMPLLVYLSTLLLITAHLPQTFALPTA